MPTTTQDWNDKLSHKASVKGWDRNLSHKQNRRKMTKLLEDESGIEQTLQQLQDKKKGKTNAIVKEEESIHSKANCNPYEVLNHDSD
jgi:hypothetical protein